MLFLLSPCHNKYFNTDILNKTLCLDTDNTLFYYGAVIIC